LSPQCDSAREILSKVCNESACLENIVAARMRGIALRRAHLFALMARNVLPATTHFGLPDHHVVEIGIRVDV